MSIAGQLVCVTGRFQPLHRDHVRLMLEAAERAQRLFVAITNPYPASVRAFPESEHRHRADANPFTFSERSELVQAALAATDLAPERFVVVPFDLAASGTWPDLVPLQATQVAGVKSAWERAKLRMFAEAGYPIRAIRIDPHTTLSSTAVREAMRSGARGVWAEMVPAATVPLLDDLLLREPLVRRIQQA